MIFPTIQKFFTSLYKLEDMPDVGEFLIDRPTFLQLCKSHRETLHPGAKEELVIIREDGLFHIGLYIGPEVRGILTKHNPFVELTPKNIEAFLIAVEGISHFIYFHQKIGSGSDVSLIELELQAELDKFIICRLLTSNFKAPKFDIHRQIFDRFRLINYLTPSEASRYREANRLAARYCKLLEQEFLRPPNRFHKMLTELRTFYSQSHWTKLSRLAA